MGKPYSSRSDYLSQAVPPASPRYLSYHATHPININIKPTIIKTTQLIYTSSTRPQNTKHPHLNRPRPSPIPSSPLPPPKPLPDPDFNRQNTQPTSSASARTSAAAARDARTDNKTSSNGYS
ncbi:hypothetical protein MBLNU457_7038t3 [Dothideomycetes sp. NU457]